MRDRLTELERAAANVERQLESLTPFAGDKDEAPAADGSPIQAPHTTGSPPPRGYLKGAEIRVVAAQVRASTDEPAAPLHHSDWFHLVCDAGYGVAGEDPRATFLTQLNRSPVVKRADERGLYLLDLDAPRRLSERLRELYAELASLNEGQQTIENITTTAARRLEVTTEAMKIDRDLEEASRSLRLDATA